MDKNKTVGATETIQIQDRNVANINIGLREAKIFDLRLDKFVSRIIIQNNKETITKGYNDSTLAKAELDAKLINSTNVIVEYKIRITNEGEVPGYVGSIVDYVSSEYQFSSELNSSWYEQDGKLYNTSLMNGEIAPGDTREVMLILTKKMTETSNMGLISNTAEIHESYNAYGLKDVDSIESNNTQGEDDLGKADVILSIKTGGPLMIGGIIICLMIFIGIGIYVVIKKYYKKEIK